MDNKIQTINLYNESGIAIGLTVDHDICALDDSDLAVRVVGHAAYCVSAQDAARNIRAEYLRRNHITEPLAG